MGVEVKYPDVEVRLTDTDSNPFAVMGAVTRALRRAGVAHDEIDTFRREAMGGDYDHLLQTCMRWVDVS